MASLSYIARLCLKIKLKKKKGLEFVKCLEQYLQQMQTVPDFPWIDVRFGRLQNGAKAISIQWKSCFEFGSFP
jgi:hypothetical protein